MSASALNKATTGFRRARQVSLAAVTLAFSIAACTDDAVVYPNRNLTASGGGTGSEAGPLADAGEVGHEGGAENGGASSIDGGGGSSTTGGGSIVGDDDEAGVDAAGASGATSNGPVCGNGIVEPPEECDDGNTVSGDGCSAQCKSHCETCEGKVCSLANVYDLESQLGPVYDDCYKATGTLDSGPAKGVPRADVCRALVDCVRQQKCAQEYGPVDVKFNRCWCDVDWSPNAKPSGPSLCTNVATFVPGKCANQFQEASEGDTATAVISNFTATSRALGKALRLLSGCDEHVCVEECLPEYFGDTVVATIAADLTATRNSAGESQLGDLTADAQRAAAASDAAVVSGELALCQDGVEHPLAFSATADRLADADGRVLWSEAIATQYCYGGVSVQQPNPFLNNSGVGAAIVKETLTGQQLYDALTTALAIGSPLYVSGLTYTWSDGVPSSRAVVEIQKNGVAIDKAASFTVAMSDALAGMASPIKELTMGTNPSVVPNSLPITLFGQYLSQLPQPVSPPTLNRITCQNCATGIGGSGGTGGSTP